MDSIVEDAVRSKQKPGNQSLSNQSRPGEEAETAFPEISHFKPETEAC
jgi:hypothetical protein